MKTLVFFLFTLGLLSFSIQTLAAAEITLTPLDGEDEPRDINIPIVFMIQATDIDGEIVETRLQVKSPTGIWNWQPGYSGGTVTTGVYNVLTDEPEVDVERYVGFTATKPGKWTFRAIARTSAGWTYSDAIELTIDGIPMNLMQLRSAIGNVITIDRVTYTDFYTLSKVKVNGGKSLYMLEYPLFPIGGSAPAGISATARATPGGDYRAIMRNDVGSDPTRPKSPRIEMPSAPGSNIPANIQIHLGNSLKDSAGCLLPGATSGPGWLLISSQNPPADFGSTSEIVADSGAAMATIWSRLNISNPQLVPNFSAVGTVKIEDVKYTKKTHLILMPSSTHAQPGDRLELSFYASASLRGGSEVGFPNKRIVILAKVWNGTRQVAGSTVLNYTTKKIGEVRTDRLGHAVYRYTVPALETNRRGVPMRGGITFYATVDGTEPNEKGFFPKYGIESNTRAKKVFVAP